MSDPATAAETLSRRNFLKLSATSAALLSIGGGTAVLAGCSRSEPAASGYEFLRAADLVLLNALSLAIVPGGLPTEPSARSKSLQTITKGIDSTCVRLGSPSQKKIRQLFDLLTAGLTRRLAAGVSKPWNEASAQEVTAFLNKWRHSSIGLFNSGYRVLVTFITLTHYASPEGAKGTGYPGPLAWVYAAANAP